MAEFHPDLSDPARCISAHWSLPVQCVLKRAHRENWHEALTPGSGARLRYRYTVRVTQELRDGEWRDLVGESPGLTDSKLGYIRHQFGQRPIVAEVLAEVDRLRDQLDLAQELYIRVPIHPLSHVVVRRERAGVDLWAVTDGSLTRLQVWVDRRWQYVGDVGRAAAFCWPLEEALAIAQEAAAAEARSWADGLARSKEQ